MAPKSPTARIIEAAVNLGPKPLLASLGYRKSGRSFFLLTARLYKVVNFQSSMSNSPSHAKFTINLNVALPCFHEAYLGTAFPKNPANAANVIQQRIGRLLPNGKDHWWEITTDTDPQELGNEVAEALSLYGLPYLHRINNVDDLVELLNARNLMLNVPGNVPLFRAILLWCSGKQSEALNQLDALRLQNEHRDFGDAVAMVQERLQAARPPD